MVENTDAVAAVASCFFVGLFACMALTTVLRCGYCLCCRECLQRSKRVMSLGYDDDVFEPRSTRGEMAVVIDESTDAEYPPGCVCCMQSGALMRYPCGHAAVCPGCTSRLERYPLCRVPLPLPLNT